MAASAGPWKRLALQTRLTIVFSSGQVYVFARAGGRQWNLRLTGVSEMDTHAAAGHAHQAPTGFIRKYIFSLDHKVIGKQYYFLALLAVVVGMILSWLIRIRMVWPNARIPGLDKLSPIGAPGGVMTPEYYLSLLPLHGTLMIFFVLTTAPQSGFGNYFF